MNNFLYETNIEDMSKNISDLNLPESLTKALYNIEVVEKIQRDEKLSVKDEYLSIDQIGILTPLRRFFNRDNRYKSLTQISDSVSLVIDFINEVYIKSVDEHREILMILQERLLKLSFGMDNLSETYRNDQTAKVIIDRMISVKVKPMIKRLRELNLT
jgi:hypothetical protein